MTMAEVVAFVARLRRGVAAPVRTQTPVTSVRPPRMAAIASRATARFCCRSVVIASGACNAPHVPALRAACRARSRCFTPFDYRNPAQLPDGGVLVVGASATGAQLADEIRRSGRRVTLSVGEHVRLPRMYRGRDVLWWMEASGVWNQRYDEIDDLVRARRLPSPQLIGTPEHATLDLNTLCRGGRRARRALERDPRRPRALLGRAAQPFLARGSEDGAAARHVRRVGAQRARATRFRPGRALRADARAGEVAARARLERRRDPLDRLGDGLSARIRLARRCPSSITKGTCVTTAASSTTRPGSMRSACRCCGGASRRSSWAPRTTRATSSRISRAISTPLRNADCRRDLRAERGRT